MEPTEEPRLYEEAETLSLMNRSYDTGYTIGKSRGFICGTLFGICVTLFAVAGNYVIYQNNRNLSQPPAVEQVQPSQPTHRQSFLKSKLPDKLNKELRLK